MDPLVLVLGLIAVVLAAALVVTGLSHRRMMRDVRISVERMGGASGSDPATALHGIVANIERTLDEVEHRRIQYHGAIHGAAVGILVVEPFGSIAFANPAAERFINARHGDAVAEVRARELIQGALQARTPQSAELDVYTPSRRLLHLTALPLVHDREVLGVVAYIDDLTERRRIDAIRKDFVANVSHELKSPLGALSVLAETLTDAEDPEVRRRLAGRLGEEASRMAQLVDDILTLSHLESAESGAEPVPLAEVFEEAAQRVAIAADERGVAIEVSPPDANVRVSGHRGQLVSALSNLLDNAVKYSVAEGREEEATVWFRSRMDGSHVVVEVEDRGVGIPEAHRDRIFERFYRVDRARSRGSGGTGLGLSIVRHIAINHGGEVSVESTPGAGSTFRLRLPRWNE